MMMGCFSTAYKKRQVVAALDLNTIARRSTGSNYSGHSRKEQGKKEPFVRFSEQQHGITTVYR
jgi:hypothetical protein